jgi:hypothetical protein
LEDDVPATHIRDDLAEKAAVAGALLLLLLLCWVQKNFQVRRLISSSSDPSIVAWGGSLKTGRADGRVEGK